MRPSRGFSLPPHWRLDQPHLLAILLPPLAVHRSGRAEQLPLNIFLTLLFWVPGVVHAWHVVGRAAWERERQFVSALQHHLRH